MGFIYSFKVKDEFDSFERLPSPVQGMIEKYIVKVIYESFIVTADQDYLTARVLAQKGLDRAFYWASSQCLEKYFKAFLLLRGIAVNGKKYNGHPIIKLFKEVQNHCPHLKDTDLKPHSKIKIESKAMSLMKVLTVDAFIKDIEKFGTPDNRYNTFGVEFETAYLFALDNLVDALRGVIGVIDIRDSFKNIHPDFTKIFENQNPAFSHVYDDNFPVIPNDEFPFVYSNSTTTIDILMSNSAPNGSHIAIDWLKTKMKLPSSL